jgi:DNA-binding HxlR family transcriptional regulator
LARWGSSAKPGDVFLADCPARLAVDIIADKWAVVVIYGLSKGPVRHGDLVQLVGGISKKMLTQTLRRLESHGLALGARTARSRAESNTNSPSLGRH